MTGDQTGADGVGQVNTALVELRRQRPMSRATVAERLDWPLQRVVEIEQPACQLTRAELDQLLDLYMAPRAVRRRLAAAATETGVVLPEITKAPVVKKPRKPITPHDAARFRDLYDAGATVKQVAEQTGFGPQRVYRSLRKTGKLRTRGGKPGREGSTRGRAATQTQHRPSVADHYVGMTPKAIATKYGVTLRTVHQWLADAETTPDQIAHQASHPMER